MIDDNVDDEENNGVNDIYYCVPELPYIEKEKEKEIDNKLIMQAFYEENPTPVYILNRYQYLNNIEVDINIYKINIEILLMAIDYYIYVLCYHE